MKYLPLGLCLFLVSCFIGPVEDLYEQVEDTYFSEVNSITPKELGIINPLLSLGLIWNANVGNHNGADFSLVAFDEFFVAATSDGTIKKYESFTGRVIWEKNIGTNISIGIGGNSENLLIVSDDGYLWCLDGKGDPLWKVFLNGEVFVSPIIHNSKIFVRIGNYEILGIDVKEGVIQWRFNKPAPPLTLKKTSQLVLADDVLYAGFPAGKLVAIHADSGGYLWESNVSKVKGVTEIERLNEVVSKPVINEGTIYAVSTNGSISSIDRRNGRLMWTRDLSSNKNIQFNGYDIFVTDKSGSVFSLDKNNGSTNWRLADLQYRKITSGIMLSDYFIEADFDGFIHVIDSESGLIIGRSQIVSGVNILDTLIAIEDKYILAMSSEGGVFLIKFDEITQVSLEDKSLSSSEEKILEIEVEAMSKADELDGIYE